MTSLLAVLENELHTIVEPDNMRFITLALDNRLLTSTRIARSRQWPTIILRKI
jgi:hypothetical protein